MTSPGEHFEGKSVSEHLKDARKRGALASAEIHGVEMSGSAAAFADSTKETALLLLLFWLLFSTTFPFLVFLKYSALLSLGWILWKTARSALIGWSRMERLHRLIEQERWEIQHHRSQEREELREMYQIKGLSGKLLDETVEALMADDNRLLRLMLEEELGLTLEAYEHPLKQASGACLGSLGAALLCLSGFLLSSAWGLPLMVTLALVLSCTLSAKLERNRVLHFVIWNLAAAALLFGTIHFLTPLVFG